MIDFFRIGFDNLPAEYLGYSGFLLTELWLSLSARPQLPALYLHVHITPDTTTHYNRHPLTQLQLPPSHQTHNHSYPHHIRYTTSYPIIPDTQQQLPSNTRHHYTTPETTTHHTRHPPTQSQLPPSHQIPPAHNHSYIGLNCSAYIQYIR